MSPNAQQYKYTHWLGASFSPHPESENGYVHVFLIGKCISLVVQWKFGHEVSIPYHL